MYPAIEIDLHLQFVFAAQRQNPAAPEAAFRATTYATNLLPLRRILAKRTGGGVVIAGCADDGHRRPADPPTCARARSRTSRPIGGQMRTSQQHG
jgi:hypothetical protein